ncbi:hypothetical protein PSHT_09586 [Puccinia striiformis]|uniref:Uncharacterized protein n=2 Tax=Puccinia striiformis TaxID=27350 RepID=A0A2S4UEP6_9BASI|nr:hypothetical protein Pst134EB_016859 [Puccinia striiformis f. sp. tritici]POV95758.1 hypothetical protein PSTT_16048 [Puccinia striiformis]POW08396.1 hypothetical protein PSHT_09586 [Puccinia striiformis]
MPIAHGLLQEARPEQVGHNRKSTVCKPNQPFYKQFVLGARSSQATVKTNVNCGARKRAVAKSLPHHGIVSACPSHLINVRTDEITHDPGGKSLHTEGGLTKR